MYSSCDVRVEYSLFPPIKSPFFTGAISLNDFFENETLRHLHAKSKGICCFCKSENKNNIRPQQFHESAIGQHLLDNAQCALHYSNEKFSILARGRSSFHLSALEATFIKSLNPFLCKQKEFVYSLKIS